MNQWSIATVCLGGALEVKLAAAAKAGFRAVELFENDLTFFRGTASDARRIASDLGLEFVALQPLRDFEAAPEPQRRRNLDRARRKLELTRELGAGLLCLCSTVAEDAIDDVERAAEDLADPRRPRAAGGSAARLRGARLGPPRQGLDEGVGDRRKGRSPQSRHRARQFPYLRARQSDRADRLAAARQDRAGADRRRAGDPDGPAVAEPALPLLSRPGRLPDRRLSRRRRALRLSRPAVARNFQRAVPRRLGGGHRGRWHALAARGRRGARSAARPARRRGHPRHRAAAAGAARRRTPSFWNSPPQNGMRANSPTCSAASVSG